MPESHSDRSASERASFARAEWEANTKAQPRETRLKRRVIVDQFRQYGEALAILEWSDICTISKIESLHPGIGAASRLLEYVKSLGTRYQVALFGNATAYLPDVCASTSRLLSQEQLERWYRKHDFVLCKNKLGITELWYPKKM